MSECDLQVRYRTQFILNILKSCDRRDFESLVDFGCGDGRIFSALADELKVTRAAGIDYRAPVEESTPQIQFVQTDFLEFAPSEPFDLVTSIQVFEHIYEPWLAKYFAALERSCKAEGVILVSTPNRWRPSNLIRAATLRKPWMMNANPGVPPEQHLGHHRECSYRQLSEILNRFFPETSWRIQIVRPAPRRIGSTPRWLMNLVAYYSLWPIWRPLCSSASHDHYAVIQRR